MSTALSKKTRDLKHQEDIIQDGLKSFLHVGQALLVIRDDELYCEQYESFESYCKDRWKFSRQRAYQYIEATETVKAVSTIVDTTKGKTVVLPSNEAQSRALHSSADDDEDRAKVWQAAVAAAPKNSAGEPVVTAKIVKAAAEELLGSVKPKPLAQQAVDNKPEPPKPAGQSTASIVKDSLDRKVPEHLTEHFATAAEIASAGTKLDQLKKLVGEIAGKPGGEFLELSRIEEESRSLKSRITAARYWTECPRCQGKPNKKCDRCDGHGFLPVSRKSSLSDDDKSYLGITK